MAKVKQAPKLKCERCGYKWTPRVEDVRTCANPKCRSPYWDVPRKEQNNGMDDSRIQTGGK
jgi:hypothetical protein